MFRHNDSGEQGFSVVELLIYVVIVAVLTTISVALWNTYRKNALINSMEADVATLRNSMELCFVTQSKYPTSSETGTDCRNLPLITSTSDVERKIFVGGPSSSYYCAYVRPQSNKQGFGNSEYQVYYDSRGNGQISTGGTWYTGDPCP